MMHGHQSNYTSVLQVLSLLTYILSSLFGNRVEYTLEEIKGGSSLGVRDVAEKPYYTFGRTPNNGAPRPWCWCKA